MEFEKTAPGTGKPDSADGTPSQNEGTYTIKADGSNREYQYTVTRIPGSDSDHCTYCFEIQRPLQGDTISLKLSSSYPSPTSAGGTNTVWGTVLAETEKDELDKTGTDGKPGIAARPADGKNTQTVTWTTEPDTFQVEKKPNTEPQISGDGAGNSYIRALSYTFATSRTTTVTQEGVGKDHVTQIEAVDTFTLPEGVSFDETFLAALESGTFQKKGTAAQQIRLNSTNLGTGWWYQVGDKDLLALYNAGEDNMIPEVESISLSENQKTLTVKWKLTNTSQTDAAAPLTEIGGEKLGLLFADNVLKIDDPNKAEETSYTLHNKVGYTWQYSWSENETGEASCESTVALGEAKLELKKSYDSRPYRYGDPQSYTITAKNTGALPYNKLVYVTDTLPDKVYLRTEDILKLLNDETWGEKLTITISDAVICPVESSTVKAVDGSDAGSTSVRNTSAYEDDKYHGMSDSTNHPETNNKNTITIKKENGSVTITLNPGDNEAETKTLQDTSADSIQSALDGLGFLVTSGTRYTLRWDTTDADGKPTPIQGGQTLEWEIPCAVKDTFMLLGADAKYAHPNESYVVNANTAYAYGKPKEGAEKDELLASASSGTASVSREFTLSKGAKLKDGSEMDETNAPKNGETIDYSLYVTHNSSARYDLLPLTDHMSGAQVLLADQEKNQNADWAENCATVTVDGTTYYKLTAGTYSGVWLNGSYADSVTVTGKTGAYDTLIKWYFKDYGGTRNDTVSYKALVELPEAQAGQSVSYDLNNESWLNDHQTHRLYAPVGTKGSLLNFDKKIVSKEDMTAESKAEGETSSVVSEGQTVYYRLTIYTTADSTTLSGSQLRDTLPLALTDKSIQWKKGSANAENAQPGDVWIEKYENTTSISSQDGSEWSIEDTTTANTQSIAWNENFSVTFGIDKPLYIYVRLTFPKGAQWQEYAAQYGTTTLTNTFYLDGVPKTVTHTLGLQAQAYLQKGVYSTEAIDRIYRYDSTKDIRDTDTDSLWHYANNDAYLRGVVYYALVYNGGATRLYLQDLQDVLPQGFTYRSLIESLLHDTAVNDAYKGRGNTIASNTSADELYQLVTPPDGTKVTWVDATVTATPTDDRSKVSFRLTAGTETDRTQLHYDEARKMYYLDPGEGVKFLYLCATNEAKDTLDTAENSIAMPYYDFNHSGLAVSKTPFMRVAQDWRDKNWYHTTYTPNDGSCSVIDNEQAVASGRTDAGNDTQWLYSAVRQTRREIKPGITKALAAAISTGTDGTQTVKENPAAAHPTDTLRWTVTAANDGTAPILDYALTDTMQSPYVFDGNVDYAIRNSAGTVVLQAADGRLFTVSAPDKNGQATLEANASKNSKTLTVNGEAVQITANMQRADGKGDTQEVSLLVRLTKDETSGNYQLAIRFPDSVCGIPAGGSGVLTVHTRRTDNLLENKVFVNTCFITPMSQTWDNTTNKGNMTTLDDVFGENNKPTVRNSAPVTTAYGYVTSSLKSVEEKADPNNKATCNETPNYIVLPGKESLFTYTLSVDAPDDQAMDKLILIDGLPDVNDHSAFQTDDPRYSEFQVAFADTPNVTVTVTNADGTVTTLTSEQYKVEYNAKTSFDADDWKGTSTWNESSANARSLRVKIEDTAGTLIPAKSKVSVRFDAKISGDAKPGQIAWNSFGYHYSVVGDPNELEAAPLKVGVMIPSVPEIVKQIVDQDGNTAKAKADKTFRFLLYTGESLNKTDESTLGAALTADSSRKATLIELTVKAGESASEKLSLSDRKVWSFDKGVWKEGTDSWTWEANAKYTLVELPDSDPTYKFSSVNGSTTGTGYTFTYAKDKTLTLTAVNRLDLWSFTIQKTDAENAAKTLTGAWFALYSPEQSDQMTEDAYDKLTDRPTTKPDFTLTVGEGKNAKTWYLCQLAQTRDVEDKKGTLVFTDLLRDEYLYREIQAPMGYQLDDTIRSAKKTDVIHTATISNTKVTEFALPKTGGVGTFWFTAGGALLIAGSLLLGYKKNKQRKRKGHV